MGLFCSSLHFTVSKAKSSEQWAVRPTATLCSDTASAGVVNAASTFTVLCLLPLLYKLARVSRGALRTESGKHSSGPRARARPHQGCPHAHPTLPRECGNQSYCGTRSRSHRGGLLVPLSIRAPCSHFQASCCHSNPTALVLHSELETSFSLLLDPALTCGPLVMSPGS